MGDQTNRIEQKIDYILTLLQPKNEPEKKETKKEEKKEIKQRPTATE